ncbi:hypothetical protein NUW58_g2611 [Xylaria curta]|uniref:Uncharacterized protein n=1 Tax=Xylaria curta TaxID=42375 RepID=A0ACC1PG25_9PEZI|nr:hypothetical protein NUW58_g2611 [Xylaria curta]
MEVSDPSNSTGRCDRPEADVEFALRTNLDDDLPELSGPSSGVGGAEGDSKKDEQEAESGFGANRLTKSDGDLKGENESEFGMREASTYDARNYDVVLIHGIRDSCKTVWINEDTSNWVSNWLLKEKGVNLLEFRYDVRNAAPIYSEGIEAEAVRLLEDLLKLRRNRPLRPLIFVTRDVGGIIAQTVLLIASSKPWLYGNVAQVTNLMIFYNCPHRIPNLLDAYDTMIKLLGITSTPGIPGASSLTALSAEARKLAEQVYSTNHRAIDAMLWQHIPIVNIVSLPLPTERDDGASAQRSDKRVISPAYCLEKNWATVGQPLECSIFTSLTHFELAQGKNDVSEMLSIRKNIRRCFPRGTEQYYSDDSKAGTPTWRYLLSECPPVSPPHAQNVDEELSDDIFWCWFSEQKEYQSWYQGGVGTHVLHAYGSSSIDIWSDKIYNGVNMSTSWPGAVVHFKFDRDDVRFNNTHGMVSYLVAQLSRRLMFAEKTSVVDDFASSLGNFGTWSTINLIQWMLILRQHKNAENILYIVSCVDQCKDDIFEILNKIRDIGEHTELKFRMLVTSDPNNRESKGSLLGCLSINMDRFVAAHEKYSPTGVYRQNRRMLEELSVVDGETKVIVDRAIASCGSDFHASQMLLAWFTSVQTPHDLQPVAIEILRNFARPPSVASISAAIRNSLPESLRATEQKVSIIVATALHPLSIDQIAWALISDASRDCLEDPIQRQQDAAAKIQQLIPGLYELKCGGVRACHDNWKSKNPETNRGRALNHARMATFCLGYLSIHQIQEDIENFCKADLDNEKYPPYFGNNLTAYSVKFLSRHTLLAADKRLEQELFKFFENTKTRMAWYNAHFGLTRHIRRPLYFQPVSALPVVAQTGLTGLTEMFIESEKGKETFVADLGIALIEAARYGRRKVVNRLLQEINIKAEALKDAVSYAASYGSAEPLHALVRRCATTEDFEWPEDILHRASWLGLTAVVRTLLEVGVTPNPAKEPQSFRGYSPLILCMVGRHRWVASLLIRCGAANVNAGSSMDSLALALARAARYANPDVVTLLLLHHAYSHHEIHKALVHACYGAAFTAAQELLKEFSRRGLGPAYEQDMIPLATVAEKGYIQCAKALITHGVSTNVSGGQTLPLLSAVQSKRLELASFLLDHGADPNMTTEKFKLPLLAAVENEDIPMVELLVKNGAKIEMVNKTNTILKTALSCASAIPNQALLTRLLRMRADVNHIPVGSPSPLFAAVRKKQVKNVMILLERGADVNAVVPEPFDSAPVNAAYDDPALLGILIENGADINHLSVNGTVLFQASRFGHEATVEFLLEYGKNLQLNKEFIDKERGVNNGMSPLCIACKNNHAGIIHLLLEAGANIQHSTSRGAFPLGICAQFAPRELPDRALRALLEYRTSLDLNQQDLDGNTALHQINSSTPLVVVELLVNAGASLNVANRKGDTPLMVAIEAGNIQACQYLFSKNASLAGVSYASSGLVYRAALSGVPDVIQMVVDAGADVDEIDPLTGQTPLYTLLATGNPSMPALQWLVGKCKADVNLPGRSLEYPIIKACASCDWETVRFLVEAGADLNVKDHAGRSPVHVFYCNSHYRDIDFLVDHGADLGARDKLGRTALHYAAAHAIEKDVDKLLDLSKINAN